jgi:tetratricopeptide (TPR) repeat protein
MTIKTYHLISFIIGVLFHTTQAQTLLNIRNGCHFNGDETPKTLYGLDPSEEAVQIVGQITAAIGLEQNFVIKSANVPNALASTEGGQRYILYSTTFLENFKKDAQTKWAAYSVLAHEVGHHLNNDDFTETDMKKRKVLELAADRFAGNVLQKMGATLAEAQAGVNTFSRDENKTHPPKSARLEAIASGWKQSEEREPPKPKNPSANEKKAQQWFDKGRQETTDHAKEIDYYTRALDLKPDFVPALLYRGWRYAHAYNYDEAAADYEEVIRLDPKNIAAYIGLGNIKDQLEDYEGAILEYDKAIKLSPKDGIAYGWKGCALHSICNRDFYKDDEKLTEKNKIRLQEALKILDKAIDLPINLELKILDKPLDSPENIELRWWVVDAINCKRSALLLLNTKN